MGELQFEFGIVVVELVMQCLVDCDLVVIIVDVFGGDVCEQVIKLIGVKCQWFVCFEFVGCVFGDGQVFDCCGGYEWVDVQVEYCEVEFVQLQIRFVVFWVD